MAAAQALWTGQIVVTAMEAAQLLLWRAGAGAAIVAASQLGAADPGAGGAAAAWVAPCTDSRPAQELLPRRHGATAPAA